MKNILLCIDFHKNTSLLVEKATDFALKMGARIWVLHVADPDPDFAGYEAGPQYIRDEIAHDLRKEHSTLQHIAQDLNSRGIQTEALLVKGQTVDAIMEEIAKLNIELVVLGYSGHGFFHRMLVGENTPRLLRKSPVPVLIFPTPEVENP